LHISRVGSSTREPAVMATTISPRSALRWRGRARHDILDPVQDYRPDGIKQNLVLVGVKLAHREAAAGRQSVSDIHAGKPDTLSKASTWPLLAPMNKSRSSRGNARKGATLGRPALQDRREG
jgi:hypothetical protein